MSKVKVRGRKNGPLIISGSATYVDDAGKTQTTTRIPLALCRCGKSGKKPFCDGGHRQTAFKAPEITLLLDVETETETEA